jgi:hypothetical protein
MRQFRVRCDCGDELVMLGENLRSGNTKSCGCQRRDVSATIRLKHSEARKGAPSVEYRTWVNMITRCENSGRKDFKLYGGRGIKVCARWRHGEGGRTGFECFLADMGRRPPQHSIDRYPDNDGDYEPRNCRWATASEQNKNQRRNKRDQ